MQFDRLLSYFTRRIGSKRGMYRAIEPLRRYYVKYYQGNPHANTIIRDYDGTLAFKVDRSAYMSSAIYWRGYHHLTELRVLDDLLTPEMVVADVGANCGEFTLYLAKRLINGTVLAFEPVQDIYDTLNENVRLNNFTNVRTFNVGLADKPGLVEMYTSTDTQLHHSFHEGLTTMFKSEYRDVKLGAFTVKTFDEIFVSSGLSRLDAIKIDVEGAELPVLQGAAQMIRQYKPIILLEVNEETCQSAGYHKKDLLMFLNDFGYELYLIARNGRLYPTAIAQIPDMCNVVARVNSR